MATTLPDCFTKTYAINLPEREDRRRALLTELGSQNFRPETRRLEIFSGVRPDSAAGFPNREVRGCFLSHLGVLGLLVMSCQDGRSAIEFGWKRSS